MELTQDEIQWAKEAVIKTGLFTACSEDTLNKLVDGLEKQHYKQGATILFQGEISSKLCLVQKGKVSINVKKGAERFKVAELGSGSYFGEISLLMPRAATATVKAEEESEIFFLPGEVVQGLMKTDIVFADFIKAKIEQRLKAQEEKKEEKK